MPETVYPISCRSCSKSLYGPVKYCPYCGIVVETAPTAKPPGEPEDIGQVREQSARMGSPGSSLTGPSPELQVETSPEKLSDDKVKIDLGDTVSKDEPAQEEKVERQKGGFVPSGSFASKQRPISGNKDKDKIEPESVRLPWKWATVAILLLVVIVVYFVFRGKGLPPQAPPIPLPPPSSESTVKDPEKGGTSIKVSTSTVPPIPPPTSAPPTTINGKRETARVLALEALRQGTNLSVTICNLPKFEKVLQAAQQLQEISPRYQDQVASAESTISNTRNARDQSLMAYLNKVLELGRYTPEQVSYAMDIINNGDPTPREKIVAELLASHLNHLRNNPKPDPVKMLSNFTQRFSDFVD